MLRRVYGRFLLVFPLLTGCQSTISDPFITGYDYFPLTTGQYTVYDVQESRYALNNGPVHQSYQRKEVVGAPYTTLTGETAYRLKRYHRTVESQPWQADSVWSARLLMTEGIRTENGQDFVKLAFPVSEKLSWNGNRHNSSDPDNVTLRNVGKSFRVLDKQFNESLIVVAQDDSTLLSQHKRIEVYARQVGLIYKERTYLMFCSSTPACLGHAQIEYGIRQVYRIRSYGKE